MPGVGKLNKAIEYEYSRAIIFYCDTNHSQLKETSQSYYCNTIFNKLSLSC